MTTDIPPKIRSTTENFPPALCAVSQEVRCRSRRKIDFGKINAPVCTFEVGFVHARCLATIEKNQVIGKKRSPPPKTDRAIPAGVGDR